MRGLIAAIISLSLLTIALPAMFSFAEDRKDLKHSPPPEEYSRSSQGGQANKPILPPTVVPAPPSAVSPTPSPFISSPPVIPTTISPPPYVTPGFPQVHIPTVPSTPANIPSPNVPFYTDMPQVPILGNTIGEVLNKGTDKKGILWLEVRDQLFNQIIRIRIRDLKSTPITKQAAILRFEDIKLGDTVNIIFTNEGENNIASFISVLTKEEMDMMKAAPPEQVTVSGEPDNQDGSAKPEEPAPAE